MGSGGRNVKTKAQKLLSGTYQPVRDKAEYPLGGKVNNISDIDPPPNLSEGASKLWLMLADQLINDGLLHAADQVNLQILVYNIDQYWKLEKRIHELCPPDKITEDTARLYTQLKRSADNTAKTIRTLAGDFGFSPSSRKSLMIEPAEATIDITDGLLG